MPNWCSNTISITGSDVPAFRETLKTTFSFNQTVPEPDGLDDNTGPFTSLYIWHRTNWGTKWDISGSEILENTNTSVVIRGETAWMPPTEWAKRVSQRYPNLHITIAYCEVGCAYYGTIIYSESGVHQGGVDYVIGKDEIDDDFEATGKLGAFVNKYQLRSLGG